MIRSSPASFVVISDEKATKDKSRARGRPSALPIAALQRERRDALDVRAPDRRARRRDVGHVVNLAARRVRYTFSHRTPCELPRNPIEKFHFEGNF